MLRALHTLVFVLVLTVAHGVRMNRKRRSSGVYTVVSPPVTDLPPVGVIMNPGGFVAPALYVDSMMQWQAEAVAAGISLWFSVLEYARNLPLPTQTKEYVHTAITRMQGEGLPEDAPVYFTGHSMGGGAALPVIQELYDAGVVFGAVLQAAYITRSFFPPVTDSLAFTTPTLTVGAELNYGAARLTRMAEAMYRQPEATHPVVIIEGMNHGQYFTGGSYNDLQPEISHEEAQQQQAKVAVDWMANQLGLGSGDFLASEVARTKELVRPVVAAFELEGSRNFNVPNQVGTPGWECARGVCPQGSQWISEAQAFIAGKAVADSGVQFRNNFADLDPWVGGDREPRKPFINDQTIQAYVMASSTRGTIDDRDGAGFTRDLSPFATKELVVKFVSRQTAGKRLLGRDLEEDADLCAELNNEAYKYALENAGNKTRRRFEAHGQKIVFDATTYGGRGPDFVGEQMTWREEAGQMHLQSRGLFTKLYEGSSRAGVHYCKLLSPAKAMEWVYLDGLKNELYGDWQ